MTRLNNLLCVLTILLLFAHGGYFLFEQKVPYGAYFASGISLFENGEVFTERSRMQIQKDRVYDFQNGEWSRFLSMEIKNYIGGSLALRSTSEIVTPVKSNVLHNDNEINFNQAYYAKGDTSLTLYRVFTETENLCFFITELHRLRCFGVAGQ